LLNTSGVVEQALFFKNIPAFPVDLPLYTAENPENAIKSQKIIARNDKKYGFF